MALALWDASPVFAASMQESATALSAHLDWSLEDVLRQKPGAPTLDRVDVVQPALFAVMVSLATVWRSFGVRPSAVAGHSQGEIAAAYVAGALSLDDAARVVAVRSRLMGESLSGRGGMVSAATSADRMAAYLERFDGRVSVAAVNGPSAVVVSGEPEALTELLTLCEADDVRARRLPVDYAAHSAQIEAVRDRLLDELASVAPRPSEVPLYSTVTGARVDTTTMGAEYWYRNLRDTVRFEEAVRAMAADRVAALIECSPHPVLTAPVLETVDGITAIGSLRRDDGGLERFITSLAEAHVAGVAVDWTGLFGETPPSPVTLPTYAFQRRRYWLAAGGGARDASMLGQTAADHPLLDAVVTPAGGDATVFTGLLSLDRHPWLADHVVTGTVLVPASAFVELALHAGTQTGAPLIEELTIGAPLPLDDGSAVAIQVTVSEADTHGRRRVGIHSRDDAADAGARWTEHAAGTLAPAGDDGRAAGGSSPSGRGDERDVGQAYERLAAAGYEYGPAFQGLRRLTGGDGELTADVAVGDEQAAKANEFHVHPVLLESALQAATLDRLTAQTASRPETPVSFAGVRLHRGTAAAARARVRVRGDGGVEMFDDTGEPLLSIEAVQTRPLNLDQLGVTRRLGRDLYEVGWTALTASRLDGAAVRLVVLGDGTVTEALAPGAERYADLAALENAVARGAPTPDCVIAGPIAAPAADPLAEAVHAVSERALELLKGWLASEHLLDTKLVLLTSRALAVGESDVPDLTQAALPGLVRSAETEHPDRFAVLDLDVDTVSPAVVAAAFRSGERELALRGDVLLVPRLTRVGASAHDDHPVLDPDGTVLITGGTGGLGSMLATHLAAHDGARHVLLTSRRGPDAPGAAELIASLAESGCEATIVACDMSDRTAVARLLAEIPAERPLTAVFHAAGVLDDGVIPSLDAERLRRVMAPKLDAAIYLDELTRELGLSEFVLFSSAAGTLGTAGQGNYASANAFLDAMAHRRRSEGRPAISLAFGLWERGTGMTSHLSDNGEVRTGPLNMLPMPDEDGLALISLARAVDQPVLLPMRLNLGAMQARAAAGLLPSILSGLVRASSRRSAADPGRSLAELVSTAAPADRERVTVDFVRRHAAAALGYPSADSVEAERPFKELGIDSVSAVELRNRLAKASGVSLPPSLIFDHPTPAAVATALRSAIEGRDEPESARESAGNGNGNANGHEAAAGEPPPVRGAMARTRDAVRRAGVAAHGSTWTRRLLPAPVALAGAKRFAAEARRRRNSSWRDFLDFHEELLWHTPLRGTEADVAERAVSEFLTCLEMFWRPWLMSSGELSGVERLRRVQAGGRGAVLAFPHFGPFHALGPISQRHDLGVSTIFSPHHYEDLGSGYDGRLARRSLAYLEMLGEGRSIARAVDASGEGAFPLAASRLQAGELVAVAFDMVGILPTPFLGRTVRLTNGPVRLARSTGALILPAVLRRHGMVPILEFGEPIDPSRFADETTLQAALARQMEVWALELPEAVWPQQTQPGGAPLINGPQLDAEARHNSVGA